MSVKPYPPITDALFGRLPVNFYMAKDQEFGTIMHGTPGLSKFCALPNCTEVRGVLAWNDYLYAVARRGGDSVLFRISATGVAAELGFFSTSYTGPVWMVNNYTQLLIVDGVSGYVYTPATGGFAQITSADFPGAQAAAYQDTYGLLVQPDSIYWFFSTPLDFTTYDSLNSYAKEGWTDKIQGILSNQLQILVGGFTTTEIWQDVGGDNTTAQTPTFQRVPGGLYKYGWASPAAACVCDNTGIWVTDQGQVLRLLGYSPSIISTDMTGRLLAGFNSITDVIAFTMIDQEHTFFIATFPSGGRTIVYDTKMDSWHERSSYLDDGSGYGRWRVNCCARFNNGNYGGDYSNGLIYQINPNAYDDNGNEIQGILTAPEVHAGEQAINWRQIQVVAKTGVGTVSGAGTNPYAALDYSEDGGFTFSTPRPRSMGQIGATYTRLRWLRNGQSRRRMWRVTITAPVERQILGVDWGGPK